MQAANNIYGFTVQFTEEQRDSMLEAAGGLPDQDREDELFTYLASIARDYVIDKAHLNQPQPSVYEREFDKLRSAAKKINRVLRTSPYIKEIHDYLFMGIYQNINEDPEKDGTPELDQAAERKMYEIVQSLILLEKSIDSAIENIQKRKESGQATESSPIQSLFYRLCVVWHDYFGRNPGTSVGGPFSNAPGKAGGPFIRFVKEYLSAIVAPMSPEFRLSHPDIVNELSKDKESIRNRVRQVNFSKLGFD